MKPGEIAAGANRSRNLAGWIVFAYFALAVQGLSLWWLDVGWFRASILGGLDVLVIGLAALCGLIFFKTPLQTQPAANASIEESVSGSANVPPQILANAPAKTNMVGELRTLELLTQDQPLPEVLHWLATHYEQIFPGMMCSILLLDADGVHVRHGTGPSLPAAFCQALDGAAIGPRAGSCGTAAYTCKTTIVTDIRTDPLWQDYKDLALAHGLQACWSVPMISSQDAVLGTFAIYYHEPRAPTPAELAAIEHGASLTGLVIERHRLMQSLREASEFSRQVISCAREGITVFDRDLRRQIFNPFMEELSSWTASQVLGRTLEELMPTEQSALITANLRRALQGETIYSGDEFIAAAGGNRAAWVSSKISPLRNAEGEITGVISVLNDISERKQAEEKMREAAAFTAQVIAGAQGGIAVFDLEMRYRAFNPFLEKLTGWKAADVIGQTVTQFVTQEHASDTTLRLKRAFQGEIVYSGDLYLVATADHPALWINSRTSPMYNANGEMMGAIITVNDITERKAAEMATAKLAAIVESSQDAMIAKDLHGIVQSWNTGAEKIFGYRPEEMVGQSIMRLIPPDLQEEERQIMARVRAGERTEHFETVRMRKDGSSIHIALTVSPLNDTQGRIIGASKVARDITERKQVEQAMRLSEIRYRELFQSNPHPMFVFDLETLKFLAVNDAAMNHYGYSSQEFMTMSIQGICLQEDIPAMLSAVANSTVGLHETGMWRHCTKDGRSISVEVSTHPIEFDGHKAKVVLAHDVTKRLAAEAQVAELNSSLERRIQERTDQLTAMSRELESFCYSVSHDLKAPLRGIDGYSRLLLEEYQDKLDADGRQFLLNVRQATKQMTELIDDLLTYSKQERRSVSTNPIELSAFVTGLVSRTYPELGNAQLSQVQLEVAIEPLSVQADYEGLTIALRNLIDNAIKFSSKSAQPLIRISSRVADGRCVLRVQDNGIGFDMRFYDRIFEIFQRLQRAEDYPGTGIGLALARKAVERMGGKIWAESQPGEGASFYIELPEAAPAADPDSVSALSSPATPVKEFNQ